MTDRQFLLATDVVSTTGGRRSGFRVNWTLPVLAIVMTACAAGCGTANSDDYEAISDSQFEVVNEPRPTCQGSGFGEQIDGVPDCDPITFLDVRGSTTDLSPARATLPDGADAEAGAVAAESVEAGSLKPAENSVASGDSEAVSSKPAETVGTELPVLEPREIKLLVPERTFQKQGREQALRVTFDDVDLLKVLNMDPVQADAPALMPGWLKGLDGKKIRLRGFMYPTFQDTGIEVFLLARDNDICCFGRSPKVYDIIKISMKDGETTDYIQGRPFDVIGVFHIAEQAEVAEDALPKLYSLTDAVVISR
jgi:hypothetical protein